LVKHDLVAEDDYFNREEQCVDRLESIKATIAGDSEEIAMCLLCRSVLSIDPTCRCVDRSHTLIEFLQTDEEFPEKFQCVLRGVRV
jgi:hypothetical protein